MDARFADRYRELEVQLRAAAELDYPHPFRPMASGRPASVLLLVGIREATGAFEILVTRRTQSLETHKGQYALPGGMRDSEVETPEITALRETEEEVGVAREEIEVCGRLPTLWTPSGFSVTPIVGILRRPVEAVSVRPNAAEIDFWFWCGIERLREAGVYSAEPRTIVLEGVSHTVSTDVYQVGEHRIWGVTGAMLRNFLARLAKIERKSDIG
jgi:8-oxo-dGTP pyrophosphatase MutT (NUDIX family)